jgi:hypothetical protein
VAVAMNACARSLRQALWIGGLVLALGCGSESNPAAPTQHPAVGVWTGTFTDRAAGSGTMRLDLHYDSQNDTVTGTWTMTLALGTTLQGTSVVWARLPSDPFVSTLSCAGVIGAGALNVRIDSGRMQGEVFFFFNSCSPLETAAIALTRQ